MTIYRICPQGADKWKVQQRDSFWWRNVLQWKQECFYAIRNFDTEAAAEKWIDDRIAWDRSGDEWAKTSARRKREIRPRRYP